jgi:hypothetical protein
MVKNIKYSMCFFGLVLLINTNFYLSAMDDLSSVGSSFFDSGSECLSLFSSDDDKGCIDFITELPDEVAMRVLHFLEEPDLVRAGHVCKNWRRLARDWSLDQLWRGYFLKKKDNDVNAAFALAVQRDALPAVRSLIDYFEHDIWNNALLDAACGGREHVVEFLINKQGIDVNVVGQNGPPLVYAAQNGHMYVVQLLLGAQGIDVNKAPVGMFNALMSTILTCHTELCRPLSEERRLLLGRLLVVVALLLNHPDVDVNTGGSGITPLTAVARGEGGKLDLILVHMLLARQDIDINKASRNGHTPLIQAALGGNIYVVELLLARPEIDVKKRCDAGKTALEHAAGVDHWVWRCVSEMIREHQKGLKKGCCVIS